MSHVRSIIAAAVLVGAVAGCASQDPYYPRSQAYRSDTYNSNGYAYVSESAANGYYQNGNYYPPATAYPNPNPYSTSNNYYSSRADYYRNYQGIHGGPERN